MGSFFSAHALPVRVAVVQIVKVTLTRTTLNSGVHYFIGFRPKTIKIVGVLGLREAGLRTDNQKSFLELVNRVEVPGEDCNSARLRSNLIFSHSSLCELSQHLELLVGHQRFLADSSLDEVEHFCSGCVPGVASAFHEVSHRNDYFDGVLGWVGKLFDLHTGGFGHTNDCLFDILHELLGLGIELLGLDRLLLKLISTMLLVFEAVELSEPTCLLSDFVFSTWLICSGPLWHPHDHLVVELVRVGRVLPLLLLLAFLRQWNELCLAHQPSVVGVLC